tara:strand:+ start:284 stop:418 length:135 start_codon:yes stop_codon:yes gene_type:complete
VNRDKRKLKNKFRETPITTTGLNGGAGGKRFLQLFDDLKSMKKQ